MTSTRARVGLAIVPAFALAIALSAGAAGASVTPQVIAGNPTCASEGYGTFELKVEPVMSGTYYGAGGFELDLDVHAPYIDWASNYGVNAVVVKGGPNANLYVYSPKAYADTNLSAPTNPENGMPYGLSHVSFCYDIELQVTKTADTVYTRTWNWTIDKSVTPAAWDLFKGDSGTSDYSVAITKTGYTDSDWAVTGEITIHNPAGVAATITGVSDVISPAISATVDCDVTFPYSLAAGGTLTCDYSAMLPDGTSRTNTATVTTTGMVDGGSGQAAVTFGDPTTVVNGTINVSDTYAGDLGAFSASGTATYSRTFACDADEGTHDNTATIVETGQSDDASVDVDCYDLAVTKDADTSFTRTWTWTIDKSADEDSLVLAEGQLFQVNYEVVVDATKVDSDQAVSGDIHVNNPAPMAATINAVTDVVSPAIAATVDCGVTFPYSLAAGATLDCTYSADLPNKDARTNTATATLQNHSYSSALVATATGTTDFTGTAAVSFADATMTEIDECIDVSDTNVGVLGTVCAADAPKTYTYSLWFGTPAEADVVLVCGDNTHMNTASFVTNDTDTTGDDDWTVDATVECDHGCTLTPGYWKTHSILGPAPYDDAWLALGDVDADGTSEGAGEAFFGSGQTYYQVLWTPSGGNPYYILAKAYIAAELNILNGASSPAAVDAAISYAESFFATHNPDTNLSKAVRTEVLAKAMTLDSYNNGLIGPGHCSQ